MPKLNHEDEHLDNRGSNADLIIAYLSYALEDVRAISPLSTQFLEMAIMALSEDLHPATSSANSCELKLS
jgi:hypothetical protein